MNNANEYFDSPNQRQSYLEFLNSHLKLARDFVFLKKLNNKVMNDHFFCVS